MWTNPDENEVGPDVSEDWGVPPDSRPLEHWINDWTDRERGAFLRGMKAGEQSQDVIDALAATDALRAENEALREELANRNAEIEGLESERAGDDLAMEDAQRESERLRVALEKHHDLLSDEPGDNCNTCGTAWDGALANDKRA